MLRPFKADPALCDDGDLSGPLLFAFALGSCHLLARGVCLRLVLGLHRFSRCGARAALRWAR